MSTDLLPIVDCSNRLLRMLDEAEYRGLLPHLQRTHLGRGDVLCERGKAAAAVYFPCTCVLSMVTLMRDGTTVEAGTIGREGFVGIDVLLDAGPCLNNVFCQVEGVCLWMPAEAFRGAIGGAIGAAGGADTGLRRAVQRFALAYLGLVAQSAACNRVHKVEERFARWMLMTADRVGSDSFYLTQDFIAQMLGVHRPSVSTVASAFQHDGLIRYTRGQVTLLDRPGLERASCECYAVCTQQAEMLLQPAGAGPGAGAA